MRNMHPYLGYTRFISYCVSLSFIFLCLSPDRISSHELCTDGNAKQNIVMTYCTDYTGATCCSVQREQAIQAHVNSLNLGGVPVCRDYMRKILCAECDPWSAHLFNSEFGITKNTSILCDPYCDQFYSTCGSVTMSGVNPYGGPMSPSKISDFYPTKQAFCDDQKPIDAANACYSGSKYVPSPSPPPPLGSPTICVEQVNIPNSDSTCCRVTSLVSDGERLFITKQGGQIQIYDVAANSVTHTFMTVPNVITGVNEAGLLSIAFHPNYKTNGKFYVYYSCTRTACPVPCTSSVQCNGNTCSTSSGVCTGNNHATVVSEFRRSTTNVNQGNVASERRLLVISQPYGNHNAGQLLFSDADGYLYISLGDGGNGNDPNQLSQNVNSLLGKILRIDVDGTGGLNGQEPSKQFKIPSDNPFGNEIWATGLRNPWRCSFDSGRPLYMFCGDAGQDVREEWDIIVKGGNYGWRKWEGTRLNFAGDPNIPNHILPIIEYTHAQLGGNPSAIGGYIYRGNADPRFYGKYVFGDHNPAYFVATELPSGSWGSERVTLRCISGSTSATCGTSGKLLAFGEDHNKDFYISTHLRTLKLVDPARCGIVVTPSTTSSSSTTGENNNENEFDDIYKIMSVHTPVEDTYVRNGEYSNQAFGSEQNLVVKYASSDNGLGRETFIKFQNITSDQCSLKLSNVVLNPVQYPFKFFVSSFNASQPWGEATLTWNEKPTTESSNTIGPIDFVQGVNEVNVSSIISDLEETSFRIYASSENTLNKAEFPSKESSQTQSSIELNCLHDTIEIPLLEDATVRSGSFATQNFGSESILTVKYAPDSDYARETFLKFNLSTVSHESGYTVIWDKCWLYLDNVVLNPYTPPFEIYVSVVDNSWSETGITWNNKPLLSDQVIGPITVDPFALSNSVFRVEVTPLIVTSSLTSFRIYPDHETEDTVDRMDFASKESNIFQGPHMLCTFNKVIPPEVTTGTDDTETTTADQSTTGEIPYGPIHTSAISDTYVRSGTFANQNFGSESVLSVKYAAGASEFARETFIQFDISTLPFTNKCILRLFNVSVNPHTQPPFSIHITAFHISEDIVGGLWGENLVTWNLRPQSNINERPSKTIGPLYIPSNRAVYDFDVTSLVYNTLPHTTTGYQSKKYLTFHLHVPLTFASNTVDKMDFSSKEFGYPPELICSPTEIGHLLQDAFVRGGSTWGNDNYGSDPKLLLKTSSNLDFVRETFLMFTRPEPIAFCLLTLRNIRINPETGPFHIRVSRVILDDWDEYTIRFNDKPVSDVSIGPLIVGQLGGDYPLDRVSIDVTSLMIAFPRLTPAVSFRIHAVSPTKSTDLLEFSSKEAGAASELRCEYDPVSTTSVATTGSFSTATITTTSPSEILTCSSGWRVTGYFCPLESEYPDVTKRVNTDKGSRVFRTEFLYHVETEGWGETIIGDYLGFYSNSYHIATEPLDSQGNVLQLDTAAVDPRIIPFGTRFKVSSLAPAYRDMIYVARDIGLQQTGSVGVFDYSVDLYMGVGKIAEQKTFDVTGSNQVLCMLSDPQQSTVPTSQSSVVSSSNFLQVSYLLVSSCFILIFSLITMYV